MIARGITGALAAAALAVVFAGCSTPAIDPASASELQDSVVSVAEQAADGDNAAALTKLDELQAQLDQAVEADLITAARAARVQKAIDAVRADLEALVAPAPEPSPTPSAPAETGGDDNGGNSGNSGSGNDDNGGSDNSGPGNNNGNGNGNSGNGKGKDG